MSSETVPKPGEFWSGEKGLLMVTEVAQRMDSMEVMVISKINTPLPRREQILVTVDEWKEKYRRV
jgi:hypothetical protein